MVKVLVVFSRNMRSGGMENYLLNSLSHIHRDDLEIDMLVSGKIVSEGIAERFRNLGCTLRVLNISAAVIKSDIEFFGCLGEILSSETYDVVHVNTLSMRIEALSLIVAKREGVKIRIAHAHSVLLKGSFVKETIRNMLRRIIINHANEFLACSTAAAESLVGKKESGKVQIAKNGIDVEIYRFNEKTRNKIRTQYGWNDRFVIGIIARISPEKNHTFLIKVMEQLVTINKRAFLVMIGKGDKMYEKQIEREIQGLELENYVQFLGEKDNINEIVQGLDLHVLPSIWEGLGIVNVEAQASGLHCICSDGVPKEANITGLVEFIPLEKGVEYWAEEISKYDNGYKREDKTELIKEHGYDITSSARIIDEIYHIPVYNRGGVKNSIPFSAPYIEMRCAA